VPKVALTATGGLLGSQLIVGVIALYDTSYEPQRWQQFLIYIGYTAFAFLLNAFGNHILPYVNKAAFTWSIAGFTIICITVLACAAPNFSSPEFVFTEFLNTTGWPGEWFLKKRAPSIKIQRLLILKCIDGVAWLLGLLQGGLGLTGYDAVAHMIEGKNESLCDASPC